MKNYDMQEQLDRIDKVIGQGPYRNDWESLSAYRVPDWYKKLRFGIFIHYGLFSADMASKNSRRVQFSLSKASRMIYKCLQVSDCGISF